MPAIYGYFRRILASLVLEHPDFNDAEAALFGDAPPGAAAAVTYELYSAYQGQKALAKAQPSLEAGLPYVPAFIDMRMPLPLCNATSPKAILTFLSC
jgi:hypothetical protein